MGSGGSKPAKGGKGGKGDASKANAAVAKVAWGPTHLPHCVLYPGGGTTSLSISRLVVVASTTTTWVPGHGVHGMRVALHMSLASLTLVGTGRFDDTVLVPRLIAWSLSSLSSPAAPHPRGELRYYLVACER